MKSAAVPEKCRDSAACAPFSPRDDVPGTPFAADQPLPRARSGKQQPWIAVAGHFAALRQPSALHTIPGHLEAPRQSAGLEALVAQPALRREAEPQVSEPPLPVSYNAGPQSIVWERLPGAAATAGGEAVAAFCESRSCLPFLREVRALRLDGQGLTDAHLARLCAVLSTAAPRLRHLDLRNNLLTDQAAGFLRPLSRSVERLDLRGNATGDAAQQLLPRALF